MLVKIAKKIVDGMKQGLTNGALEQAAHIEAHNYEPSGDDGDSNGYDTRLEKSRLAIINEYKQHSWDVEDLASPTTKPLVKNAKTAIGKQAMRIAKKATKPVAKKKTAKIDDSAFKTNDAGKRVGNDGKVIVAYPKPQGRTRVMFALVLAGASNADGLAYIQKQFKGAPTTINSLGWVRSQLRNNPARWGKRYTSKDIKAVQANRDCSKVKLTAAALDKFIKSDDESDE